MRGQGCHVWDTQGRQYVDFIGGLGCNILGYANQEVNAAVIDRMNKGATLSLATPLEVECAEKVKEIFPFIDRVKFLKTGSDACSAAIKIARAFHGVGKENEEMYGLLGNKEFTRVSSRFIEEGWVSDKMQIVCEKISVSAESNGDQEEGAGEVFCDPIGASVRKTPCSEKTGKNCSTRSEQNILLGSKKPNEEAMSSMCRDELSGTSPLLFEATGRGVAVPNPSRRKTPRVLILSDGYHGHHDAFVSLAAPHVGTVKDPYMLPLTGNEDLISVAAAVIIEPIMTEMSDGRLEWLKALRERCTRNGALLIFDEVITGFRFPKLSVSNYYGIAPDLICMGKAMANGLPISVVGGKKEVMECGEYFVSSTFAGETLSLAAALKTMTLLQSNKYDMVYLWEKGRKFITEFNLIAPEIAIIEGYPTRGALKGEPLPKALFMQEACKAGLLFGPSWFFNFKHIDVMDAVLNTCRDIMTRIRTGSVALEGELPRQPFAAALREQK